jgi:hypothetical protein
VTELPHLNDLAIRGLEALPCVHQPLQVLRHRRL